MTTSIIKKILDPKKITWADIHIAKINGQTKVTRKVTYKNTENGEEYSYLAGGFAWPWERSPGFAVVLATMKTEDKAAIFTAVDEAEDTDVIALIEKCVELRKKWGYEQDGEIMQIWWGDYERFLTLVSEASAKLLDTIGKEQGFYIAPPIDFDRKNHFEVYLRRILSQLQYEHEGQKGLFLGSCDKLRNYMANLPGDASKQRAREFPPISALGFVLHSMCVIQPWRKNIQEAADEMGVDIRELATREQEMTMRQLQGPDDDLFSQLDEPERFEDFGTKNTIPGG